MADYFDVLFAGSNSGGGSATLQDKSVSITQNGDTTVTADEGYDGLSSVALSVNVSGGGEAPENDVEFIDYDGTIVYSYTAQEFLALDAMPANPTHEGLTAQGWNWTLADAKDYVGDYGGLVIGQMYITDDGKTRIYVNLSVESRLSPQVGLRLNGSADIDWGDGTEHSVLTGTDNVQTVSHNYSSIGEYIIAISVEGSARISYSNYISLLISDSPVTGELSRYYRDCVTKIFIGANITGADSISYGSTRINAFQNYGKLEILTLPNTFINTGSVGFLRGCYSLRALTIPAGASMNSAHYQLYENFSLKRISLQNGYTANGGEYCFYRLRELRKVFFPKQTNGVNWGSNSFNYFACLKEVGLPSVLSVSQYFDSNRGLLRVVVPSTVTSIGANAFFDLGLYKIKFLSTTPPTVSASSAFNYLPTDCKIYVPSGSLSAYTSATNYPNPNTYTYVEY